MVINRDNSDPTRISHENTHYHHLMLFTIISYSATCELAMVLTKILFKNPTWMLCFRMMIIPFPASTPTLLIIKRINIILPLSRSGPQYSRTQNCQKRSYKAIENVHKLVVSETWRETHFKIIHRAYYPFRTSISEPAQAHCPWCSFSRLNLLHHLWESPAITTFGTRCLYIYI